MEASRRDGCHMDTIQRLNALWEEHEDVFIALPMAKAPVAHPKRVNRPCLRHCHREPDTNRYRGDA
jgi:hypothetical protein